jgi:DNA-binding CsgD family transcriptional regulator
MALEASELPAPDVRRSSTAQIRGIVAVRIVGELITRLAVGERWDFAAFGRDDELLLTGSSNKDPADVVALRSEIRLQCFAAAPLPHVGTSLALDQRRTLFVIFGEFRQRVAIVRVTRHPGAKPFVARDWAGIERFVHQHADALAAALVDINGFEDTSLAMRAAPIAFIVNGHGALVSSMDDTDGDRASLRMQLAPRNGEVATLLRPVVADLIERYHAGAGPSNLIKILPFALIRLAPLRSRADAIALLITVEWLRSDTSLEVTAARYAISKRELQVLRALLRGAAVADIAHELSISESTVVFHLKRMLKKTLSKNRVELAARMLGWESAQSSQGIW